MTVWTPKLDATPTSPGKHLLSHVFGATTDPEEVYKHIEAGFNVAVLENFLRLAPDASSEIKTALKLSDRTLTRRRSKGQLSPAESDRFYRLVDLYARAADVLESVEAADEWMTSPALALGNRRPLEYARNEVGARRVEALLTRIEHGVFS